MSPSASVAVTPTLLVCASVIVEGEAVGPDVMLGDVFGRGFTVTFTNPDALPPLPSLTVTSTRYTVEDVTRGGVYVAVAPEPDTLPPVADQE